MLKNRINFRFHVKSAHLITFAPLLMDIEALKKHIASAKWQAINARGRQFVPSKTILNWLSDKGSLTKRLIKLSNNQFKVSLLAQSEKIIYNNEASALKKPMQSVANVREVLLSCNNIKSVFARTVIPLSTLTGKQIELGQLNNKPLGAYLFSQPDMVREPIEITCINLANKQTVWGRRSVFYLENKPLLVAEFFLPDFFTIAPNLDA